MSAWDDYITLSKETPSRSGLYANLLPGVTVALFDDLTKDEQADFAECFSDIYTIAKLNFTNDVQGKLGTKFHYDQKLISRETSKFLSDTNIGSELAGIKLEMSLPKYARMHVISVEVFSNDLYESPPFNLKFYDTNGEGEVLLSKDSTVTAERNIINIDTDFEVDKLFIGYDPGNYNLRKTENKYFNTGLFGASKLSCTFPCGYGDDGYTVGVFQINGGGLNVKFVVTCSVDKFICENINLFKTAFWYRIGVDLMRERIMSDRFNRFTTLTEERVKQLKDEYQSEYDKHLMNSIESMNINEDPICFECKNIVESANLIP